jgi:hypothetical protein
MRDKRIYKETKTDQQQIGPYSFVQKRTAQLRSLQPPDTGINFTIQKKENKTGLPDNLKSGIENLSGMDISDVKVHYNSSQPAQLNAHAYAQGNQIHVAPGQEKHLAHEAWHVVQQKQGRVQATKQLKAYTSIGENTLSKKHLPAQLTKKGAAIGALGGAAALGAAGAYIGSVVPGVGTLIGGAVGAAAGAIAGGLFGNWFSNRNTQNQAPNEHTPLLGIHVDGEVKGQENEYRSNFTGTSAGVEQELIGVKLRLIKGSTGVIGKVYDHDRLLAEYTTDMGKDGVYTVELRSTPTELNDMDGLAKRKQAIGLLVKAIETTSREFGNDGLKSGDLGPFQLVILGGKVHSLIHEGSTGYANQVTVGVSSEEIGTPASAVITTNASWFQPELRNAIVTHGLPDGEKAANIFAYIASVIIHLAEIIQFNRVQVDDGEITGNIYHPSIKNKWDVLPRTAPWKSLSILSDDAQRRVKQTIAALATPAHITAANFKAAKQHIQYSKALAGHEYESFVNGKHASLFEFREPPHNLHYLLHSDNPDSEDGEVKSAAGPPSSSSSVAVNPMKDILLADPRFARSIKGKGKGKASDSDSDNDDG